VASDAAAHGSGFSAPLPWRTVLGGLSLLPLAAALPAVIPAASGDAPYQFPTPHQAAVLDAATHRLVPGPEDNPPGLGVRGRTKRKWFARGLTGRR
jgi:hypothetical protein